MTAPSLWLPSPSLLRLAWAYVLYLGAQMGVAVDPALNDAIEEMPGMDMSGMDMASAIAPDFRAWAPADFAFIFVMWAVMMVAMMTPSVTPMVLLYALVGRKARMEGKPFAPAGWFFAGYVFIWVGFSILATGTQWLLASMALLTAYDGNRQFNGRWFRSYRGRPLSVGRRSKMFASGNAKHQLCF